VRPLLDNELAALELIHATAGGEAFLARQRQQDRILAAAAAKRPASAA
jgi:hypothetical protein